MNKREIMITWKMLCTITAIGACIGLAVVNMGFMRPPQRAYYYWYPERFFTGLLLGGAIAFLAGLLLKTILRDKSPTIGEEKSIFKLHKIAGATKSAFATAVGFPFIALERLFLTLRHFALLKSKRNYILAIALSVIIAFLLILTFSLGGSTFAWREDIEAHETFPNGLKVDSAKWRLGNFDKSKSSDIDGWEAEITLSWNGQKTLSGSICGTLLDADGYQISEDDVEIAMPPQSKKTYKLCNFFSIGSQLVRPSRWEAGPSAPSWERETWVTLPPERVKTVKRLRLRISGFVE
jgi:hypothetical protein